MSKEEIEKSYGIFWDKVKHSVDDNGWAYVKDLSNILDAYFESNTGKQIEYQKSFGSSGSNENWLTRGARWRPKELSEILKPQQP